MWNKLSMRAANPTPFNHPTFCLAWLSTIGQRLRIQPHIITVYNNNNVLKALAPLCNLHEKNILTGIGTEEFADYHDWLVDKFIRAISTLQILCNGFRKSTSFYEIVLARVKKQQTEYFKLMPSCCLVKNTGASSYSLVWNNASISETDILKTGGRRFRLDTLRCRRLLRKHTEYKFIWYNDIESIPDRLVEFIRKVTKKRYIRTGAPDLTARPGYAQFLHALLKKTFAANMGFCVALIGADGYIISAQLGMALKKTLYWYLPAYDRKFCRFSPGRILILETLLEADKRSYSCLDFTWGDDPYKLKWCNKVEKLFQVYIRSRN